MKVQIVTAIQSGVPVPGQKYCKWPFAEMKVGDSFFTDIIASRLHQAASHWKNRQQNQWKFVTRTVEENGIKGVRIWRIE